VDTPVAGQCSTADFGVSNAGPSDSAITKRLVRWFKKKDRTLEEDKGLVLVPGDDAVWPINPVFYILSPSRDFLGHFLETEVYCVIFAL
jgi:hypothetical protein